MASTSVTAHVGFDDLYAQTWRPHGWALIAGDVVIHVYAPGAAKSNKATLLAGLARWAEAVEALPDDEDGDR